VESEKGERASVESKKCAQAGVERKMCTQACVESECGERVQLRNIERACCQQFLHSLSAILSTDVWLAGWLILTILHTGWLVVTVFHTGSLADFFPHRLAL
jgi:hypothetical protein